MCACAIDRNSLRRYHHVVGRCMDNEIARIVAAERRRSARAAERRKLRLAAARNEAERLAERMAKADPTLTAVVLFGSVASGSVRSDRFDIDLAVDADDYLHLRTIVEESAYVVDLVDLRSVSSAFRERILQTGIVLYES